MGRVEGVEKVWCKEIILSVPAVMLILLLMLLSHDHVCLTVLKYELCGSNDISSEEQEQFGRKSQDLLHHQLFGMQYFCQYNSLQD